MGGPILRYTSDPNVYGIHCDNTPYREAINELSVTEYFFENDKFNYISPGIGDYYLTIETEVNNAHELQSKHFEIKKLIQEIDCSWMYACGHPFNKRVLSFIGPYVDFPDGNINGWSSNFREAERDLYKGKASITFNGDKVTYSTFSYWPPKKALKVREAYLAASESIMALVDLHFFAHKVEDSYSSLFFLAKAMEIVRAILPGKTDEQREKDLPYEVRSKIKSSLRHIMDLANNRYEIRHIVKDKKNCTLHEKLNNTEINDYKHDADIIIRL